MHKKAGGGRERAGQYTRGCGCITLTSHAAEARHVSRALMQGLRCAMLGHAVVSHAVHAVPVSTQARSFVRPSGTEDIVRVYAEAATQADADALAVRVGQVGPVRGRSHGNARGKVGSVADESSKVGTRGRCRRVCSV